MQGHLESCKENLFPVCLGQTLSDIFGDTGKKYLDSIVMNETFRMKPVASFNDVWMIYGKYVERIANIMEMDVAQVLEFHTIKEMKRVECPLHEIASGRIDTSRALFMKQQLKPTIFASKNNKVKGTRLGCKCVFARGIFTLSRIWLSRGRLYGTMTDYCD